MLRQFNQLSEARSHFASDKATRGDLNTWFQSRYALRYAPDEIVKNGYLKVPGKRGWYWLDPKQLNQFGTSTDSDRPKFTRVEDEKTIKAAHKQIFSIVTRSTGLFDGVVGYHSGHDSCRVAWNKEQGFWTMYSRPDWGG
jgi:hypothetical protein